MTQQRFGDFRHASVRFCRKIPPPIAALGMYSKMASHAAICILVLGCLEIATFHLVKLASASTLSSGVDCDGRYLRSFQCTMECKTQIERHVQVKRVVDVAERLPLTEQ